MTAGGASAGTGQGVNAVDVGGTTLAWYLGTTAVAIGIGLMLGTVFQPGTGVALTTSIAQEVRNAPGLVDTLLGMIPTNPLAALAEGNILQIIVFALLMGVAIMLVGEPAKPVQVFFCALSEVMYKMTSIVMEFAPYGVYALITAVAAQYGLDVLVPLAEIAPEWRDPITGAKNMNGKKSAPATTATSMRSPSRSRSTT